MCRIVFHLFIFQFIFGIFSLTLSSFLRCSLCSFKGGSTHLIVFLKKTFGGDLICGTGSILKITGILKFNLFSILASIIAVILIIYK